MTTQLLRSDELRGLESLHAETVPPLMERAGRAAADFARKLRGDGRGGQQNGRSKPKTDTATQAARAAPAEPWRSARTPPPPGAPG